MNGHPITNDASESEKIINRFAIHFALRQLCDVAIVTPSLIHQLTDRMIICTNSPVIYDKKKSMLKFIEKSVPLPPLVYDLLLKNLQYVIFKIRLKSILRAKYLSICFKTIQTSKNSS